MRGEGDEGNLFSAAGARGLSPALRGRAGNHPERDSLRKHCGRPERAQCGTVCRTGSQTLDPGNFRRGTPPRPRNEAGQARHDLHRERVCGTGLEKGNRGTARKRRVRSQDKGKSHLPVRRCAARLGLCRGGASGKEHGHHLGASRRKNGMRIFPESQSEIPGTVHAGKTRLPPARLERRGGPERPSDRNLGAAQPGELGGSDLAGPRGKRI